MHPALSIIFFTTTSGVGFGLFIILSIYTLFNKPDTVLFGITCAISFILIVLGLFSSTLHLANPKNAWRAFSRFKTSWLAREAVLAVVFFPIALLWMVGWWFGIAEQSYTLWVLGSLLTLGLALATVFSTGMIYACLKTIPQWNNAMTPLNYIFLSLATGSLLMLTILETMGVFSATILILGLVLIIVSAISKFIYYLWIGVPRSSSIATATGFTREPVRLLDVGHTSGTFLTDEFGYVITKNKSLLLRTSVFILAFVLPALLLIGEMMQMVATIPIVLIGFLSSFLGVLIERWLFFAEARHVVNVYHGTAKV